MGGGGRMLFWERMIGERVFIFFFSYENKYFVSYHRSLRRAQRGS